MEGKVIAILLILPTVGKHCSVSQRSFSSIEKKGGRALAVLLLWLTEYFCYPSSLPRTQHHTFGTHLAIAGELMSPFHHIRVSPSKEVANQPLSHPAAFGWTSIPPLILNHP